MAENKEAVSTKDAEYVDYMRLRGDPNDLVQQELLRDPDDYWTHMTEVFHHFCDAKRREVRDKFPEWNEDQVNSELQKRWDNADQETQVEYIRFTRKLHLLNPQLRNNDLTESSSDEEIRSVRKRKRDHNAPKRPLSAFFWFTNDERAKVMSLYPGLQITDIARELGKRWSEAKPEITSKYEVIAEEDEARYEREMSAYTKHDSEEDEDVKEGKANAPERKSHNDSETAENKEATDSKDVECANLFRKFGIPDDFPEQARLSDEAEFIKSLYEPALFYCFLNREEVIEKFPEYTTSQVWRELETRWNNLDYETQIEYRKLTRHVQRLQLKWQEAEKAKSQGEGETGTGKEQKTCASRWDPVSGPGLFCFSIDHRHEVLSSYPEYGFEDTEKELAKRWSDLDHETKSKYEAMAKEYNVEREVRRLRECAKKSEIDAGNVEYDSEKDSEEEDDNWIRNNIRN